MDLSRIYVTWVQIMHYYGLVVVRVGPEDPGTSDRGPANLGTSGLPGTSSNRLYSSGELWITTTGVGIRRVM